MKQEFSKAWVKSKQPRKQRKYRYNAPLHIKGKFLNVNLAKDLRKKHGTRTVRVRKGDTVKVMRGTYKGKSSKVENVSAKQTKVYLQEIQIARKDGSKAYYPFEPSNLQITQLNLDDKKRLDKFTAIKKTENKEVKNNVKQGEE